MFPELNHLLNTTPDRAEQVRSCAVGKGAGPGSVAEDCVSGGSACRPVGKTRPLWSRGRLGVVVRGVPPRGLGSMLAPAEGGLLDLLESSQRPCVLLKVPRKQVRRLDWLTFTDVYRRALCVLAGLGVPASRGGCQRGFSMFHVGPAS